MRTTAAARCKRALAFSAVLAACAGPGAPGADPVSTPHHVQEVRRPDGRIEARGAVVAGRQQGPWRYFHPNGTLASAGAFVDDVRDGYWESWYPDGARRMAGAYVQQRQSGVWRFWHPNGALASRGSYRDGREHGEWSFWHDNGQLQQRGCFADGKRTLQWASHDRDGRLLASGCYGDDRACGPWREAGPDGALTDVVRPAADGTYVCEPWDDGSVRREGLVRGGVPVGMWVTRHRGGALRCVGMMAGGKPDGEWLVADGEGAPFARGSVRGGRPDADWSLLDAEGRTSGRVPTRPGPPWNGAWSAASIASADDPFTAIDQWLAEVQSPLPQPSVPMPVATPAPEPAAVATAAPPPAPAPRPSTPSPTPPAPPVPRLEAPTDPGELTVAEREELDTYRRYVRDGFLPRRSGLRDRYGGAAGQGLGAGDKPRATALVGKALPVTRFPTADGGELDLASLRGRKVLVVILKGFTSQVCVYCFAQTRELAPVVPKLDQLACELVVLFPGTKSRLDAFRAACAREFGDTPAPYRLVYDPDLSLAKALGIEGNLARPSSVLLDAQGVVRYAYIAESVANAADRPPAERLLEVVARL